LVGWDVKAAVAHVQSERAHTASQMQTRAAQHPATRSLPHPDASRKPLPGRLPADVCIRGLPSSYHSLDPAPTNVGPVESLGTLAMEFKHNDDFKKKVGLLLRQGYVNWRRIRGDGNCFYRAVGFGLFEWFASPLSRPSRCTVARALCSRLDKVRFLIDGEQAAHEDLKKYLLAIATGDSADGQEAQEMLHSSFKSSDGWMDLALVRALRHTLATFLIENVDNERLCNGLAPGTIVTADGNYSSMEDFCQRVVLPEGVEAEGIVLNSLPFALGIKLRIIYIDRKPVREGAEGESVPFVEYSGGDEPCIYVQLRPGHYDLIYHAATETHIPSTSMAMSSTSPGPAETRIASTGPESARTTSTPSATEKQIPSTSTVIASVLPDAATTVPPSATEKQIPSTSTAIASTPSEALKARIPSSCPAITSTRDAEGLPAGWESAFSEEHERIYYFNRTTEVIQWVKPVAGGIVPSTMS